MRKVAPLFQPVLTTPVVKSATVTLGLSLALIALPLPGRTQAIAPVTPETTTPVSASQQTLLMGTEADYIPFEYRYASEQPAEIIGFDIDLAQQIAERLGLDLTIHDLTFEQLLPAVQAGRLDFAIAAITPTPERRQQVDFSEPYFESRNTIVSPKSNPLTTVAQLEGKRIGVQSGSIQEQAINQLVAAGANIQVKPFVRMNDLIAAVRQGDVDGAIVEELVAEAYLENNIRLEFHVLNEIPPVPLAIAFPPGSDYVEKFNTVLQQMKESGELQQLARRWFSAQP